MIVYCQQCDTIPLRSDRGDINAADFLRGFHSTMLRPVCPICRGRKAIQSIWTQLQKILDLPDVF